MQTDHQEETAKIFIANKPSIDQERTHINYFELMRYATYTDTLWMVVGGIAAAINGVGMPLFSIIFGNMTNAFSSGDYDELVHKAGVNAMYFIYVSIATFFLSLTMFMTWIITGERQAIQFRKEYFRAILRQEVGWFDSVNPNTLNSKVADECYAVQQAIQEKGPTFIFTMSTFFCGFIIGYVKGWQLALVITAILPVLALSVVIMTAAVMKSQKATQETFQNASALSEQALNSIKTVKMLDGEDFEVMKYTEKLMIAAKATVKFSIFQGFSMGLIFGCLIWSYALAFYYGSHLIADQVINDNTDANYSAGDVMTIFFSILMGSFSIGQAGPCFQSFAKGKVAALSIFKVMDRQSKIFSPPNPKELKFEGQVEFKDCEFTYPARPEVQILKRVNFKIPAGKKVALVGESGCGKSTILQLIERFYDCDQGQVLLGGIDVRELNLIQFRSQIGMIGQEPVLFATSIRENLKFGKNDATDQEMIEALKQVNAWDFIEKMEKQLDTYVGIGGGQLSGGQKQRIAIARAILKKPKLLLLDEATSALDRTNERLIQQTLDHVSKNITTIVIAHRLSTIENADIIYVFDQGHIVEVGTHAELISKGGKYQSLAQNQLMVHQQEEVPKETQQGDSKQRLIDIDVKSLNQFQQENNPLEAIVQDVKDSNKIKSAFLQSDAVDKNANVMRRLFAYSKDDRIYFIAGLISAVINGCIFPLFSLFLSKMMTVLLQSNPSFYTTAEEKSQNAVYVRDQADQICLIFFLFGIGFLIFSALETFLLQIVAENLTAQLRRDTFRKLLRMPIPYFDEPQNNAGTLTARLSVDCKILQGLTSTIIGFKVQNIASLICGMSIAFSASWALTLIALSTFPFAFFGRQMRNRTMQRTKGTDGAYKDSGNLIMEAVTNVRTVFSFGNESIIMNAYNEKVQDPLEESKKIGLICGVGFGFSQMQTFLVNALIFYTGALLIKYQGLTVLDMFRAMFGITFATMGGSRDSHFAGDMEKGEAAAVNIFKILDSVDEYQLEKVRLTPKIIGNIELKNIGFKYESRDKPLFQNLNLTIPAGAKVSFVGPSGCGKSTITQMLMRFYDPDEGEILIDGINIKDYDIRYLRRQLASVSQEPTLFNATIGENIIYNTQNVTKDSLIDAAKQANAYDFIMNEKADEFGQGFEKRVGPKGSQISGGQKQRIAIARAILRNSNILLLDEATSALDSTSEQLVQESLNSLMKQKTTIAIAHRISTIKDSEIIYVFENGQIVEQGKYDYLVSLKNFFYRLEQGIAN